MIGARRRNRGPIGARQCNRGPIGARRCNRGPIGARRRNRGPIVPWCNPSHQYYSSTPVFLASLAQLTGPESGAMGAIGADRAQTVQSGPDSAIGPRPRPGEPRKQFSCNFRGAQRETLLEPFLRAAP